MLSTRAYRLKQVVNNFKSIATNLLSGYVVYFQDYTFTSIKQFSTDSFILYATDEYGYDCMIDESGQLYYTDCKKGKLQ